MKATPKTQEKVQVWIIDRTSAGDRALLFRVIPKRGGGWHPVTGSVEKDEVRSQDWLGAAKRETQEETGLDPMKGEWVDLQLQFEFDGRWGPARERAYAFILKNFEEKIVLDPSEHEEMKWVPLDEAQKCLGFDSQRCALDAVSSHLERS